MEYRFEIDEEHNAFLCIVSGTVSIEGVRRSILDRYEHPGYKAGINLVIDLSGTPPETLADFDTKDYQTLARDIRAKHNDHNRSFVVAPANLTFGLSRQFELTSNAQDDEEIHVFRSLEHVFEWIELNAECPTENYT